MKKKLSLFGLSALALGTLALAAPALAATSARSNAKVTEYKKYETRTSTATYNVRPKTTSTTSANLYYVSPAARNTSAFVTDHSGAPVTTTRAVNTKKAAERKYYLAHPFFQPEQGKFGSLTDIAYTTNSYDFTLSDPDNPGSGSWGDAGFSGKWKSRQISVKEDISYGISDTVSIVGSARYSNNRYEFNWNPPVPVADSVDKEKKSGFDVLGLGMQWRFYDDTEWIAYFGAYYQWWKDMASVITADAKAGYKINSNATIYGLARIFYSKWDENSYGNGITNNDKNQSLFISYEEGVDNSFYYEGGIGFFSVLAEDFTLNLEAVVGEYGWHAQGSGKAAFGWQPNQWFALNAYIKTTLYDSADDAKGLKIYAWPAGGPVYYQGKVDLSKYRETSFGLQAMLYF